MAATGILATARTAVVNAVTVTIRILAAPPANADAADYLLTAADAIHSSTSLAITSVEPNAITVGEQTIPTYDLTCRLSVRRNAT